MSESAGSESLKRIASGIGLIPYMNHLGMEYMDGGEGFVKLKLPYKHENSTVAKALHGGAIASLIDTTGSLAAWTTATLGDPRYFGSTLALNVNYLSGVIGEACYAEGRILKRGKEIIYIDVKVTTEGGKLRAQGTVIYRIVEKDPS